MPQQFATLELVGAALLSAIGWNLFTWWRGLPSSSSAAVVSTVAPHPVNALVGGPMATVETLAGLGVRRISVGGALARAAWTGFLEAATEIAEHGTFSALGRAVAFADLNRRFEP